MTIWSNYLDFLSINPKDFGGNGYIIGKFVKICFGRGKNLLPNDGNVLILFFDLEWRQPPNLDKRSVMNVHCDLNTYTNSNDFFICTKFLIIQEYLSEQYLLYFEQYWGSYKSFFWEFSQFMTQFFGWSCPNFPTYKLTGVYL